MKNTDTLLETARTLINSVQLNEGVEEIKSIVSTLKVGDKTNFGIVVEIGSDSITFKAKDLPKTKIPFNARKMGSKDFVLDALLKLKEETSIKEATSSDIKIVLDAAKKIGGEITGNTIDFGMGAVIKVSVEGGKIKFDGGKSSGIEHFNNVNDAVMAFESADTEYTKAVRQANKDDRKKRADAMAQVFSNLDNKRKKTGMMKEDENLTEATIQTQTLKQILRIMETQRFSDWYKDDFDGYITGDADGKTEEEILDDLKSLFENGYPVR